MGFETKNLRNVVLLGHSGSGKTLFVESMLFESGAITRRGTIEGQNTASDYTKIEQERGNSLFSSLMHVQWRNNKINIIDTPGYDDFVGEVISSLKVADTAIMLVNAPMALSWNRFSGNAKNIGNPCLFVINQLVMTKPIMIRRLNKSAPGLDQGVFNIHCKPVRGFNPIIDALRMVMYVFRRRGKPEKNQSRK